MVHYGKIKVSLFFQPFSNDDDGENFSSLFIKADLNVVGSNWRAKVEDEISSFFHSFIFSNESCAIIFHQH